MQIEARVEALVVAQFDARVQAGGDVNRGSGGCTVEVRFEAQLEARLEARVEAQFVARARVRGANQ